MKLIQGVGNIVTAPLKLLGILPSTKPPALPAPLPTPTRDDARALAQDVDKLRKRRGGAADIVTGASGLEPAAGATGKTTLGS